MRQQRFASILVAIFAVSLLGFWGVAAAQQEDATKSRQPGGSVTVGATATATVKAIDADKRIVTLQTEDGDTIDVKCGKEVRNFDQIKIGDQVKAAAMERVVVAVGKDKGADAAAAAADGTTMIARAPKGGKPGIIISNTDQITARIDAVDPAKQTVTLQGIDDKPQTIRVASDVDLSSVKQGDEVVIRVTKGVALWVAQPREAQPAGGTVKPEGESGEADAGEIVTATATVEAVDSAKRTVTLKGSGGKTRTIHLGKEAVNFDQIKVGDQVRATVAQEVAVSVRKAGGPPGADASRVVALAPKGTKPGMVIADTAEVTAQVKSVDAEKGTFTLSEPDGGSKTVKAGPDVKLSELKAGDDVTARITRAMAIVVEKP